MADAARNWRAALSELSGSSALWDVRALGDALVDLTSAHPSGVAQLFAGRPTRLSNLIREGAALAQARRRVRMVSARTDELAQRYGVAPTYVAMGIATWRTTTGTASDAAAGTAAAAVTRPFHLDSPTQPFDPARAEAPHHRGSDSPGGSTPAAASPRTYLDGSGPAEPEEPLTRAVRAPVLLRPVRLHTYGADAEVELALDPAVELNPVLVRDLQARGVDLDAAGIAAATMTPHGFAPQAALEEIASLGHALPEFQLERRIVLGAFVHPGQSLAEDLDALGERLPQHPLIAALAGDDQAREQIGNHRLPPGPGADRNPDQDTYVGDLDRTQQRVVDAVDAGAHLLVDTPPGVDAAGTAAAILAHAVTKGARVLYVPGTKRAAQALTDRLRALGLADLTLDLPGMPSWRADAVRHVVDGLNPPEPEVDEQELRATREELTRARQALDGFVTALHHRREPWKASAYEALQALAALTSQRPGPRTQVRLEGPVITLDEAGRVEAREALARAAALGAFRLRAADTPWFGAELTSAEHALSTLEKVRQLSELMPTLLEQVESTSAQTGLDQATTFTEWGKQLRLLEGIRSSLEVFTSQVFERSAKQMAAATATRAWRAERDIDLGWSARRRLRRQARDLIRPGVSVPDLHGQLVDVERRREQWRTMCSGGAWPHLPEGLGQSTQTHRRVQDLLTDLTDVLAPTIGGQALADMPLPDLAARLERLGADDDSVRQMPERAAALSVLTSMGLAPLVADLTSRRVPTEMVGAEFELAWWSSVLEEMLTADPALSGIDADSLTQMTQRLRDAEPRHLESLTIPVRRTLRARVRAAIEADRPRAQDLYRAAHSGLRDLREMLTRFGDVAWEPRPVWMVPPMVVPTVLGEQESVDLLVLDAVQHLPVEHAIPAIARAKQVVVLGDTRRGGAGVVQALSWLPTITLSGDRADLDPEVAAFLATHGYADVVRPMPAPPRRRPIRLELVDGTGMPAPDSPVVESVQAEVDRVVDLVIDHALMRPEESLAVITLNTRHADRVREAVLATAEGSRTLGTFFDPANTEAFTVVEADAAAGLRRDAVILSLGFGKTPHGRVLHRFGTISGPHGGSYLTDALDAVRRRLTVVSCFSAEDLDPHRLRTRGARMLREVLQFAHDGGLPEKQEQAESTPDPLLNDLTERLRRRGLRVVPRYGKPGGVRIPLAVGHPALPGELVLAILTDDDTYVAEPSLRVRERHWVQRLRDRGWQVHMVYSPAVFMDPQTVADQIAAKVSDIVTERHGGAPAGPAPVVPHPIDPEDDPLVTTNATLSAIRGEQIAGAREARSVHTAAIAGERTARPPVEPGRPLAEYGDDDLDALVAWIGSDERPRTAEELRTELAKELGLTRRGRQTNAILGHAVQRSGLAVERPGDGVPSASASSAPSEGSPSAPSASASSPSAPSAPSPAGSASSPADPAPSPADPASSPASAESPDEPADDPTDAGPKRQGGGSSAPSRRSWRRVDSVLPGRASEDDPRAWGEHPENDDDRILSEKPPHWS